MNLSELSLSCRAVRLDILRMFKVSCTGHLAPALSCADILCALYLGGILDRTRMFSADRDRFILSKGHACAALYAVLARVGFFPRDELLSFYQNGSRLCGHPEILLPGVESATGALGHGICFATGTALASKRSGKIFHTYCLVGDGECQEGTVWEAVQFASVHKLDTLTVIVDCNGLQASDHLSAISPMFPLGDKWRAFGWNVLETDGHDIGALVQTLCEARDAQGSPSVVLAHTIKGKGAAMAENNPAWHSRAPKGEEWNAICDAFGITPEELDRL